MVLSLLIPILVCPGLLGTQESIRQSQQKEKREEHRARRCNLIATCVKSSLRSREIDGRPVVLRDGKLYIDTGTSNGEPFGHQYAGYYLPYPDTKYEGLVTTITDVAPIMNWVYVDKETYEVKYGVRLDAQPNLTGPFDCTRQDRRLTFEGWEGFCAVEEYPTIWALYFDRDDDGLRSKLPLGTRILEIELTRKEKRWKKEPTARKEDQRTGRAVNAQGQTPVETPTTQQEPPNSGDSIKNIPDQQAAHPTGVGAGADEYKNDKDVPLSALAKPAETQSSPLRPETSLSGITGKPSVSLSTVHSAADAPPAYSEKPYRSISSPTDTHGSSEWSSQSDDLAYRSITSFTPASSVHGDDTILQEQTTVEKLAISGSSPHIPDSPHTHPPKSPPPMPAIPEEYRTDTAKDTSRVRSHSMSSKIIDTPHPLSPRYLSRPATAVGAGQAMSSPESTGEVRSYSIPKTLPTSSIASPTPPTGIAPSPSEGSGLIIRDSQGKALGGGQREEIASTLQQKAQRKGNTEDLTLKMKQTVMAEQKSNMTSTSPIKRMFAKARRMGSVKKRLDPSIG
ncbi:hypothetical protein AOQ84DRAFT_309952 [Glonium stellatum]|uniref:Uncharacterized protein n=1 Tax=Glonium stellatum TaxID=574774 RepID=A0A8E2FB76_9PEZI|nr:hypothetical protein AOQ84DRAFT_309952 [Glonium stellatum]